MTATVQTQDTAAHAITSRALTAPLQIITAAGARHRAAVAEGEALPGWALITTTTIVAVLVVFAVLQWRDVASPLLIVCSLIGAIAAFTPDVLAALSQRADVEADA